eukprot:gene2130-4157_t
MIGYIHQVSVTTDKILRGDKSSKEVKRYNKPPPPLSTLSTKESIGPPPLTSPSSVMPKLVRDATDRSLRHLSSSSSDMNNNSSNNNSDVENNGTTRSMTQIQGTSGTTGAAGTGISTSDGSERKLFFPPPALSDTVATGGNDNNINISNNINIIPTNVNVTVHAKISKPVILAARELCCDLYIEVWSSYLRGVADPVSLCASNVLMRICSRKKSSQKVIDERVRSLLDCMKYSV